MYIKTILSGNLLEIYQYEKDLPKHRIKRKARYNKGFERFKRRRIDNAKRLRKSFTRIVRSNLDGVKRPAFLTLTMASIVRIDVAYECFSRFIARMRSKYGQEWSYIAVPEFQKRGAVHFHVLIFNWSLETLYDERDTRTIQRLWTHGFCDVFKTDGSVKLAGYLAKYMLKAVYNEALFLQKAYVCSRNIVRPLSYENGQVAEYAEMIWGVDKFACEVKEFDTQWLGKCEYRSFLLK